MRDLFTIVTERQYAITVIKLLYQSIVDYYNTCPEFFKGHIQDAFDSAFSLSLIKKVRFSDYFVYAHNTYEYIIFLASSITYLHPSQ